jgi:hypothetical protein
MMHGHARALCALVFLKGKNRNFIDRPELNNFEYSKIRLSQLISLCHMYIQYINFVKNIILTSLPFKNQLTNSVANLILYNSGDSSLHVLSFKALTQVICPGDFRVAWSFFAPRFVLSP